MDIKLLRTLFARGLSSRQIAAKVGYSDSNVRTHLRRLGLHRPHPNRSRFSETELAEAVANNHSVAGVIKALRIAVSGSSYKLIKDRVVAAGLDTGHWTGQRHGTSGPKIAVPWALVLVANSPYRMTEPRRKRLVSERVLTHVCRLCGCGPEWQGKPLVLRLDHINGIRNDHRLKNLRFLCPNCDSQTETFCGRNIARLRAAAG